MSAHLPDRKLQCVSSIQGYEYYASARKIVTTTKSNLPCNKTLTTGIAFSSDISGARTSVFHNNCV